MPELAAPLGSRRSGRTAPRPPRHRVRAPGAARALRRASSRSSLLSRRFTQHLRSPRLSHTDPNETCGCTQLPGGNPHAQDTHRSRSPPPLRSSTAAVAIAAVYTASGVSATTATFSTDKVSPSAARSCTGGGRQGVHDHAAATTPARPTSRRPAAELDGPLTIDARTVVQHDRRPRLRHGLVPRQGRRSTRPASAATSRPRSRAASSSASSTASSRGHHARVLGNLSATFAPATGFTAGAIGSTSSTAVLAVVAGPICPKPKPAAEAGQPSHAVHVEGKVSADR